MGEINLEFDFPEMLFPVARHELRSLLGAAQPDRRLAAINGDSSIKLSESRIVIAQADIKSRRGGGPSRLSLIAIERDTQQTSDARTSCIGPIDGWSRLVHNRPLRGN